MKAILFLAAGFFLLSFTKHSGSDIDGIWMGYYRTDISKEKVIVKFCSEERIEFYTGGVQDDNKCIGKYELSGDSLSFTYRTPEGREFVMQGQLNYRKTYLDGVWQNNDHSTGKFYLERQKVEERFIQP